MGGKHKQSQRTKNNARPSNSGRSAELLGTSLPTFVGFSAVKSGGFAPILPGFGTIGNNEIDPNVDSNFQLVLKKMSKKDAITKNKALQEFTELVNNCELDVLKTVLPFWPRLYCSLAVDADHRVREASHIAQRAVAVKAKRNLAPYLKQLIGPWFTSQYDSYAPAASAAQLAFQDAFPPAKLSEVIIFCQEEILIYIYDNLIQSHPETSKNLTEEENEARVQRILVASLQGYALYLRKMSSSQSEYLLDSNLKIIQHKEFWKLSKHSSPLIRSAWFSTLGALLQCAPTAFLEKDGERVTTTVLANLDETDPSVLPMVWETALLALFTVQDWWTHINVEKSVLPKLWRVLRDAAQGNASSIYPNLLPLISKFPPGADSQAFYNTFFSNIRLGLKQKSVQQSRSELNSVLTSFIECLQYVIHKNQLNKDLCESLMRNQLIEVIQWCILEGHFAAKSSFIEITNIVHYWSRNRDNTEDQLYDKLLKIFWTEIINVCNKVFVNTNENFDNDIKNIIHTKLIELFYTLKRNYSVKAKKQLRVKFSENKTDRTSIDSIDDTPSNSNITDQTFSNELNEVVFTLCSIYVDNISNSINIYLFHLLSLIQEHQSRNLFEYLSKKYTNSTSFIRLFQEICTIWMQNDEIREIVVDISFILFKYMDSADQQIILNYFSELNDEQIFLKCISQGLSHPYRNMDSVNEWLKCDKVTIALENCSIRIINDQENSNPANLALLRLACAPNDNGDTLISSDALLKIINVFCKPLLNPLLYKTSLDACARFASVLSAFIYSDEITNNCYKNINLLIALITLNTKTNISNEILSEDTMWEVNTAWQDAISILRNIYPLESDEFINIIRQFAIILKNTVPIDQHVDNNYIIEIVKLIMQFLKNACPNCTVGRVSFVLITIMEYFDSMYMIQQLNEIVLKADIIDGQYVSPKNEIKFQNSGFLEKKFSCDQINIYQAVTYLKLTMEILITVYNKNDANNYEDNDDQDYDNDISDSKSFPLTEIIPEIKNEIIYNILAFSIIRTYIQYFEITEFYESLNSNILTYQKLIEKLFSILDKKLIEEINETMLQQCFQFINMFPKSYYQFNKFLRNEEDINLVDLYRQGVTSTDISIDNWLPWILAFSKDIKFENVNLEDKSHTECLTVVRTLEMNDSTAMYTLEALSIIKIIHKRFDIYLEKDLSSILNKEWEGIQRTVEIIRLLTKIVNKQPQHLNSTHWDFIFIGLYGWAETVKKTLKLNHSIQLLEIISAIGDLFVSVSMFMNNIENDVAAGDSYKKLVEEWKEVVAIEISVDLFKIYKNLLDLINDDNYFEITVVLRHICPCAKHLIIPINDERLKWTIIVNDLIKYIESTYAAQQIAAVILLQDLVCERLVNIDSNSISEELCKENKQLTIVKFKTILEKTQLIVEAIGDFVENVKLGEQSCQVQPFTELFSSTSGYLLTWSVLLTMMTKSSSNLRFQYTEWIKDGEYLKVLMLNLLRLLPENILDPSTQATPKLISLFESLPNLKITDQQTSEWLESYACAILSGVLSVTPALVRQWWSGSESRLSRIVERITATYISPHLCNREMQNVSKLKTEHMQVRVHNSVREVVATYTVDETRMEIVISLPANYPLGTVKIDCHNQIGTTNQWRNSLMQLSLFLTHQNGNVIDGLTLWKNNLDKHFDGVEECYICFSVIHTGTYQLPKLSCQKCRKKFHSACLYKWFSTSNKSTCPICRSLF